MSLLQLENLSKSYDQELILKDLSLQVEEGQFVSIIGPSGSGKSTLFHLIGGVLSPDNGCILLEGKDISGIRGHVSFMPQQSSLFPWRTIEENAGLGAELHGKVDRMVIHEWMERLGLKGYEKAYPDQLSGGMQQRVSFLRALVSPQEMMLLDEPFSALDELTRLDMQHWLLDIWETYRRTVLFITHSIEEALLLSDRIYVLSHKPATILKEITVPFERPRTMEMRKDPAFLALREEIYNLLR